MCGSREATASPRRLAVAHYRRTEIGGERPGRSSIARVVLLQEQEERETEAAFGETSCAAMTCRAIVGKQHGDRFALIEILGVCRAADQHSNCAKGEISVIRSKADIGGTG